MQRAGFFARSSLNWRSLIADIILAGMLVGPLFAPFLSTSVPSIRGIAEIIYTMGFYVCPQPHLGVMLLPSAAMAVCMRCYGTVLGLLVSRLLYAKSGGTGFYWLTQYGYGGAMLASLMMMAYPAELAAEVFGWWSFNNYVVAWFGLVTGLGYGLFVMPILHNQTQARF